MGIFDFSGYGPRAWELDEGLEAARYTVNGFTLEPIAEIPDLDSPCGANFTFRDLIEWGETQAATKLPNLPQEPATYAALVALAVKVIDPVIEYFGEAQLTYGFCSRELAKKIPGRIDPSRDQHAAHELNTRGKPICSRLGAAADFFVPYESMLEVAQWVAENTTFDRLYFYADDRPIHVSVGPENSRQVVRMRKGKSGRLVPRVVGVDSFLRASLEDS